MFRDAIKKLSLRKKLTILATVGVLLPIFVLTYLQYRSLSELQVKTKGAFKDNVRQGLVAVELRIKQRLEDIAVQTLDQIPKNNIPSPHFGPNRQHQSFVSKRIRKIFSRGKAFAS